MHALARSVARRASFVTALIVLAAVTSTSASDAGSGLREGHGLLSVATTPTVDARVTVDGEQRNTGELRRLELPAGEHRVCFSAVSGFVSPGCETVDVVAGHTAQLVAEFEPAGTASIRTEPAGLGNIVVDGIPRDRGAVDLDLAVGAYQVCFDDAPGWRTPDCELLTVEAGRVAQVVGRYLSEQDGSPVPSDPPITAPAPSDPPTQDDDQQGSANDPVQRPSSPRGVRASHGDRQAVVSWAEPAGSAGRDITGYRITSQPAGPSLVVGASTRMTTVTGLSNGVRYTFEVRAVAGDVLGAAGTSNVVIPKPRPAPHGFSDVPDGAYFGDAVSWLRSENITEGISAHEFGPRQVVTRGQMAAFLWRLHDRPRQNRAHGFSDVRAGAHYDPAVRWLRVRGITAGVTADRYGPRESVTRGQMALFLWRAAGSSTGAAPHGFSDVPRGGELEMAVSWLRDHGITEGSGEPGSFAPSQPVTRAQMAAFLHRLSMTPSAWNNPTTAPSTVRF